MTPQFSIVIPTYNEATSLRASVNAVLQQGGEDFELIVIDDGSTDDTAEILNRCEDDRLRWQRTPNQGVSAARNLGIELARGEWTVFLDADDVPRPNWLAVYRSRCAPDVGVIGAGVAISSDTDTRTKTPTIAADDSRRLVFLPGAFAVRTHLLREIGGYEVSMGFSENTELSMRLLPHLAARGLRVVATDAVVLDMDRRGDRPSLRKQGSAIDQIMALHPEEFAGDRRRTARWLSIAGVAHWRSGSRQKARRAFVRAAFCTPQAPRAWARLLAASVPPFGRILWGRSDPAGR